MLHLNFSAFCWRTAVCCSTGKEEMVRLLVDHRASVKEDDVVLWLSTSNCHTTMAYLCKNLSTKLKPEALNQALLLNRSDAFMDVLIAHTADLNSSVTALPNTPMYPLELALHQHRVRACHTLLKAGAQIPLASSSSDWFISAFEKWVPSYPVTEEALALLDFLLYMRPDIASRAYPTLDVIGGLLEYSARVTNPAMMKVVLKHTSSGSATALVIVTAKCLQNCRIPKLCTHIYMSEILVRKGGADPNAALSLISTAMSYTYARCYHSTDMTCNHCQCLIVYSSIKTLEFYPRAWAFLLCTHPRCGAHSLWLSLLPHCQREILLYLWPVQGSSKSRP
ncbi:hypothetical protein Pelo_14935 [Pelomyxa schiedti]|nr:hypothetical protein Pelo_14935 [Pelomyxa schiedti]